MSESNQIGLFDNNPVKNEYDELVKVLNYHCDRYYNEDEPEISDYEYDQMNLRLKQIEKEHPEFIREDSPSRRVGWKAQKGILVKHNVPMLSLLDVFSKEEVDEFVNSTIKNLGEDTEFLVETKIDGLSMALRYDNGKLTTAVTRGDGINEGEDVTKNAMVIKDVVKTMPDPIEYIEIRGEVYMTREAFSKVNEEAEEAGSKTFANPRNCAAGTLRQIDTRITKKRDLSLFIFNIQESRGMEFKTHSDGYEFLKKNNVKVIDLYFKCKTADEVWDAIQKIGQARGELPYDIDGAVVKLNNIADRAKLGNTIKFPRWAIAYKYPPEEKETKLLAVEVDTGRTGRVTPVAIFEPISLCGTMVSRATLHNQGFIDDLELGIGDTIVVYKSGEIIPKIKCVNKDKRPSDWKPYRIPDSCPVCGHKLVREADAADFKCVNPSCPGTLVQRICNFVARDSMNIKGFGSEYVKDLVEKGYIKNIADIFSLKDRRDELVEEKILGLAKNTDKLLAAIEEAKANTSADKVLAGLGVPNVGKATSRDLIDHFGSIDALMNATEDDLIKVDSIGDISAKNIADFFQEEDNRVILEALKAAGAKFEGEIKEKGSALEGLSICITGTLPTLSRNEAADLIIANGGKVVGSVSKKTSYLLEGEAAGSKALKAKELGVASISEEDLMNMINS
ncbi:MAG: NAD-dependent DNA ligase LigA [Saccharofermentans sp.]|nr:NAD-dependent DNA ligase LigA [Saccharofermentans sp.]